MSVRHAGHVIHRGGCVLFHSLIGFSCLSSSGISEVLDTVDDIQGMTSGARDIFIFDVSFCIEEKVH